MEEQIFNSADNTEQTVIPTEPIYNTDEAALTPESVNYTDAAAVTPESDNYTDAAVTPEPNTNTNNADNNTQNSSDNTQQPEEITLASISKVIDKMKFRKKFFGGVNEYDVFRQIKKISEMFEELIKTEQIKNMALLAERDEQITLLCNRCSAAEKLLSERVNHL